MLPARKKPVGLKRNPHRRSPIRLWRRRQEWRSPLLVLEQSGHIKVSADPQICLHKFVMQLHAARYEIAVNLLVAISKLEAALRAEPIIHPRKLTRSFAPDPTAHDDFVIGVGVVVEKFPVRELPRTAA